MPAKKTRPANKKPVAKKAPEAPKVDKYAAIETIDVHGMTVYKWKNYTSIRLAKIKRYIDAESN